LPRLPNSAGLNDPAFAHLGVIDQTTLEELARARLPAVEARSRRLLADAEFDVASAA
jgi:hypothetical protein